MAESAPGGRRTARPGDVTAPAGTAPAHVAPGHGATPADAAAPGREPFGTRLQRAMAQNAPLCVGIDPHPSLLQAWGLPTTAAGLETFSLRTLEAAAGRAAAVKPQVALYEAHGSAGFAVLERVLREAAAAGVLSIADAKRGDIGSTMAAYAAAWLADGSPLAADAVTLSPYLGVESLRPALDLARSTGRGTFVLALTSNPEGATVQHAGGAHPVAGTVLAAVARENAARSAGTTQRDGQVPGGPAASSSGAGNGMGRGHGGGRDRIVTSSGADELGSCGVVVGATVGAALDRLGLDLRPVGGPILAPGYGAQGADARAVARVFSQVRGTVLANSSRGVLAHGPDLHALREAVDRAGGELAEALQGR